MNTISDRSIKSGMRAGLGGFLGNAVEWFEFVLYGYFATIISVKFFPADNPTVSLLNTFAVYAVGYAVRPLGGIFFSHIGDRIGRRSVLATTILGMTAATFAIGLLPTYESVGVLAPILLIALRLIQGFCAGGEYAGAAIFTLEHVEPERRGRMSLLVTMGFIIGIAAAALLSLVVTSTVSPQALTDCAWRLPFLCVIFLGGVGLYIRMRTSETPEFEQVRASGSVESVPLLAAFRECGGRMFSFFVWYCGNAVSFYVLAGYMLSHLTRVVGLSQSDAFTAYLIALAAMLLGAIVGGSLTDLLGRRIVAVVGMAGIGIFAVVGLHMLDTQSVAVAALGMSGQAFFHGMTAAVAVVYIVELFPAHLRYSAATIPQNLSNSLFGGTAPLVATYLVSIWGQFAPGYYLAVVCVFSTIAVAFLPETLQRKSAGRDGHARGSDADTPSSEKLANAHRN